VHDAVGEVAPPRRHGAMDVGGLAALVAMGADQDGPAIETRSGVASTRLPRRSLKGARRQCARDRLADRLYAFTPHPAIMTEAGQGVERFATPEGHASPRA